MPNCAKCNVPNEERLYQLTQLAQLTNDAISYVAKVNSERCFDGQDGVVFDVMAQLLRSPSPPRAGRNTKPLKMSNLGELEISLTAIGRSGRRREAMFRFWQRSTTAAR